MTDKATKKYPSVTTSAWVDRSMETHVTKLTVSDFTRLAGVICDEMGYDTVTFMYLHEAMKRYVSDTIKGSYDIVGKDLVNHFRSVTPKYRKTLKKNGLLTMDYAIQFRDKR